MPRSRFLAKLAIAILVPIVLGESYAVATDDVPGRATVPISAAAIATDSVTNSVHAVAAAHGIARAKCGRLVGVERGNCRTEARAQAKRAMTIALLGARS